MYTSIMNDENNWADILKSVGREISEYRLANGGKVPADVFEAIFPIVGQYESFGAIVLVAGERFNHQFSQKIANMDKQLNHYKLSVESVNLLTKQVARIQK